MPYPRIASLVFVTSSVIASPFATAALVSYSGSFNGLTDVTNQSISVQQFDASLGTLNSVTFTLDATMATQLTVILDSSAYVGWDKSTYSLSLAGGNGYTGVAINASLPAARLVGTGTVGSVFGISSAQNVTGPNPSTFIKTGPTLNPSQTFILNSGLSPFIGSGSLFYYLTTLNNDAVYAAGLQTNGQPSNAGTSVRTTIAANVGVSYDYTPSAVPLPGAAFLFAPALGLLIAAGRRRRAV